MRKAFTLLEVVISITIFMIVLIFLYKVLDQTKKSNKQFKNTTLSIKYKNDLNSILVEDLLEKIENITILKDKEENSIIKFKSSNTYHNPFFNNITYMISSNSKLVRIESKDEFILSQTPIEFFDNAFIDILLEDIEYFEIVPSSSTQKKTYAFIIKQKDKSRVIFSTFEL